MMRLRSTLTRLVFASLVVAVPAVARAPQDQYEAYDKNSPTIQDHFTKLEWDRYNLRKGIDYASASSFCALTALPPVGRLPTIKELLTILEEEPHAEYEFGQNVAKMIDPAAFPDTPVDKPYWTQTPAGGTDVWVLDFKTGAMTKLDKTNAAVKANVRCVQ